MKLKYEFSVREIAGDFVILPMGAAALKLSGMLTTNEAGAFLWEQLKSEITEEKLIERLADEFAVDAATAAKDVKEFVDQLQSLDLIE